MKVLYPHELSASRFAEYLAPLERRHGPPRLPLYIWRTAGNSATLDVSQFERRAASGGGVVVWAQRRRAWGRCGAYYRPMIRCSGRSRTFPCSHRLATAVPKGGFRLLSSASRMGVFVVSQVALRTMSAQTAPELGSVPSAVACDVR